MQFLRFEPLLLLLLVWLIFIIDIFIPIRFSDYGLAPRELHGLVGIFTSPFLHASLFHIISNSIPLMILASLIRLQGQAIFWQVTLMVAGLGGLLTWVFSRADIVVGASGLVFGYWSFLIVYGFMNRSLVSLSISVVVLLLYGGMIFSFFSFHPTISWAGHFFGALAGFLAAKALSKKKVAAVL